MATANGHQSSYKLLQESMTSMYRSMSPLLLYMRTRRLAAPQDKRASQQAQNLKWQQEAFHQILQLVGRVREGLATEEDLIFVRQELLDNIMALHPDGEWPEFTRDKLLFLQDLFHTGCIPEAQYHKAKRAVMIQLAEQDAEISSQDFDFSVVSPSRKQKRMPATAIELRIGEEGEQVGDFSPSKNASPLPNKKSPLKQITSRIRKGLSFKDSDTGPKQKLRVPHALDFLRPAGCPKRHPPALPNFLKAADAPADSPLFHSPNVAPSMESSSQAAEPMNCAITPSSRLVDASPPARSPEKKSSPFASGKATGRSPVGTLVSGFMRKFQGDSENKTPDTADEVTHEEQRSQQEVTGPKRLWRLDALRTPKRILGALGVVEDESALDRQEEDVDEEKLPLGDTMYKEPPKGQGPDAVKIKQKIHKQGAATDFFIDKVLGDNIKVELARIRSELQQTNPGQSFSNDQIDAIATRLPVDKSELMRFFPKYGDIVLEVVHKEFKDHVAEMGNLKKAGSGKHAQSRRDGRKQKDQSRTSPLTQTDKENRQGLPLPPAKITPSKALATTEASPRSKKKVGFEEVSNITPRRARALNQGLEMEDDLDGKLVAEIQKLPTRRHSEARPIRI